MASADEYRVLVARCEGWSLDDLGDLLHEIDRDRELGDDDRLELQRAMYRLIWMQAQPYLDAPAAAGDPPTGARE
ncbi:MAG: hypothetical protein RI554_06415 [Trueperaceae bacterium]|nr:hypothetical protein [Trueperaceae bacterium]